MRHFRIKLILYNSNQEFNSDILTLTNLIKQDISKKQGNSIMLDLYSRTI